MQTSSALLALLAKGEYLSGADIGRHLGISRAGVWKQVSRLRDEGVEVEACQNRGYRIPGGLSLLDHDSIVEHVNTIAATVMAHLEVLSCVSSTNDVAMEQVHRGGADGSVFVAESQSAGKGRRGRVWVSPYAGNIYLTVVRRFEGGAAAVEGLSLAVGVAVATALQAAGCQELQLKWPNDILCQRRKLGGVLLEIVGDPAGLCDVIVGVGVNANMPDTAGKSIEQPWIDLREIRKTLVDRNLVVSAILNELLPLLAEYERNGFDHYREAWQRLDGFYGVPVELIAGQQRVIGIARGVSTSGALQMDTPEGGMQFNGGEISLRGLQ